MTESPSVRIAAELRGRIERGELRPGERVPSAREITRSFGVAVATASRVLAALRDDGLVHAVPGVGTIVSAPASLRRADHRPGARGRGSPAGCGAAVARRRVRRHQPGRPVRRRARWTCGGSSRPRLPWPTPRASTGCRCAGWPRGSGPGRCRSTGTSRTRTTCLLRHDGRGAAGGTAARRRAAGLAAMPGGGGAFPVGGVPAAPVAGSRALAHPSAGDRGRSRVHGVGVGGSGRRRADHDRRVRRAPHPVHVRPRGRGEPGERGGRSRRQRPHQRGVGVGDEPRLRAITGDGRYPHFERLSRRTTTWNWTGCSNGACATSSTAWPPTWVARAS